MEIKQPVQDYTDYMTYHLLLLVHPVGVWEIQPKLVNLYTGHDPGSIDSSGAMPWDEENDGFRGE